MPGTCVVAGQSLLQDKKQSKPLLRLLIISFLSFLSIRRKLFFFSPDLPSAKDTGCPHFLYLVEVIYNCTAEYARAKMKDLFILCKDLYFM